MSDIIFAISASTELPFNPRSRKIVRSLSKEYKVLVLEWDREKKFKNFEIKNKQIFVKRFKLKAPYGFKLKAPYGLIFYWFPFWAWLIINIIVARPKIIYLCNLDTLIPGYISKILLFKRPKIIFDSFDKFSLAFVSPKHNLLFKIVDKIENILARNADAFVTVSEDRLSTYGKFVPKFVEIIMNCPEDMITEIKNQKSVIHKNHDELILVYAGGLGQDRGLLVLREAISSFKNVKLYLAGNVSGNTLEKLLPNPKIHYLGLLSYEEAIKLQAQADVIPILYDPSIPINRVANPNKLFEAMMLGIPVITNVCSSIVLESGCGLVVEYDPDSVKNALVFLKNSLLRKKMGVKARMAFEKVYNWSLMEKKLLELCHRVLIK